MPRATFPADGLSMVRNGQPLKARKYVGGNWGNGQFLGSRVKPRTLKRGDYWRDRCLTATTYAQ